MKSTYMAKQGEIEPKWFVVDASDMVLGRLATVVAARLRGKHKAEFTPHQLCGDTVIVVNADKVRLTGTKEESKKYYRHTGYTLKTTTFKQLKESYPERIVEKAVKGMLPKNVLGRKMGKRLHVYAGESHPHTSQQPEELKVN